VSNGTVSRLLKQRAGRPHHLTRDRLLGWMRQEEEWQRRGGRTDQLADRHAVVGRDAVVADEDVAAVLALSEEWGDAVYRVAAVVLRAIADPKQRRAAAHTLVSSLIDACLRQGAPVPPALLELQRRFVLGAGGG
jgi:hypothetical protein